MKKALHDKFKEFLKDEELDGVNLINVITELSDKADAKEKVQTANDEISKERDDLKTEVKTLKEKTTELETGVKEKDTEIEKLKESQLTEVERAAFLETKKTGMTADAEAKFNKITETLKEVQESLQSEKEARTKSDAATKVAKQKEYSTSLHNKVLKELGDANIKGTNADMALLKLEAEGLIKLNVDEATDSVEEKYFTKSTDGKLLDASLKELVTDFAANHENLVSASGNIGSGNSHETAPQYKMGAQVKPDYKNLGDAKLSAADEIDQFTK